MKKILITGPESSGKSFIAESLASHFSGGLVNEFVREYLQGKSGYVESDLLKIAKGQAHLEWVEEQKEPAILFCDTGCEVIKIWSQEKYNIVDEEINRLLNNSTYDLILLCKPNIPWQEDELRENPYDRDRLFNEYLSELKNTNLPLRIIDEPLESRISQAISFVEEIQ